MQLTILKTAQELSHARQALRAQGKRLALVPTMGALHAGHISLCEIARQDADAVMVTIFVNPTQFNNKNDLSNYPRMLEKDIKKLDEAGVGYVFAPGVEEIYPNGAESDIHIAGITERLEGAFRPGHFDGVATVVARLFKLTEPDVAVFGEKDFQQLQVIRRLVAEHHFPIQIIGGPTLRESDGLAMSSRNMHLSASERQTAAAIYATLMATKDAIHAATTQVEQALQNGTAALIAAGFAKVEYLELCDAATLEPLKTLQKPARLLVAAWLGTTRLIDNIPID